VNITPTLYEEVAKSFADTYDEARRLFDDASKRAPLAENFSIQIDDSLSTESAWLGPQDAENVVVLISGTHGAEGRVGAAVQIDFLSRTNDLPPDTALLLIFALNPCGFKNDRRCDKDGIDLNRNFLDFTSPLPVNTGYLELREAIYLPAEERARHFESFRTKHGEKAFEAAVSGGQYCDPYGPFFGGNKPSSGNRATDQIISHFALDGRHLAVIDIHSGLGAYGHGEVICDHEPGTPGTRKACSWYGASVTLPPEGNSSSVTKHGLLDYRWHRLMRNSGCFVTLEFGTYPTEALFNTILADHCAWKSGNKEMIASSAESMRRHFCPEDPYWRELVLVKGRQVIQQAMNGLISDKG